MAIHPTARSSASSLEMSISSRQRLLLSLLDALGGVMGNLDFQKILFLYCQEPDSGRPYDFVPYKRGAFSFTSYADRRKLIENELVENDEHRWMFTELGRQLSAPDMLLTAFVAGIGDLRGEDLVAETYRRFPYYATKSEIAEEVLKGDDTALERIENAKKPIDPKPLQTIGYEGHSLESYLNLLIQSGVQVLCDVRRNPLSRKYGFSKSTLANACAGVGIWYEHLPELGIASDQRQELSTQADYDALFEDYERNYLPIQTEALKTIQAWIDHGTRVALTCYEHLPQQCHRHCVAERLEALSNGVLLTRHL